LIKNEGNKKLVVVLFENEKQNNYKELFLKQGSRYYRLPCFLFAMNLELR